ncbi:hypothetical protein M5K25_013585 [Dendrobium thyrsiflorum]|uniref:Uncharacterized protein n=1 Tax=Dendrobium thyrsiflorum TaxID=117978 RepID=A0ABD0V0M1_DENTH
MEGRSLQLKKFCELWDGKGVAGCHHLALAGVVVVRKTQGMAITGRFLKVRSRRRSSRKLMAEDYMDDENMLEDAPACKNTLNGKSDFLNRDLNLL